MSEERLKKPMTYLPFICGFFLFGVIANLFWALFFRPPGGPEVAHGRRVFLNVSQEQLEQAKKDRELIEREINTAQRVGSKKLEKLARIIQDDQSASVEIKHARALLRAIIADAVIRTRDGKL